MINVTKTYLPPLEEYVKYLEKLWASGTVTNNGVLVQELEAKLAEYLDVPFIQYISNGTMAIQIALRALDIHGEVITTPFSYVATTNAILWEYCEPIFVDIDPKTFCINPAKIEASITERTRAILAVHVYGYPCDVKAIDGIAKKYNLKVIYDAAHAFGCKLNGSSLLNYGDLSTLSFHATKLFHTVEGGAIVAHTPQMADTLIKIKSFGHLGDEYYTLGLNGKNSELHAAMGLCVLPNVAGIAQRRRAICEVYDNELRGLGIVFFKISQDYEYNYAYYPVVFQNETQLLSVKQTLNSNQINPRRYFYPSLNTLPFLRTRQLCPISEDVSSRVLCLPLYESLEKQDVLRISALIKKVLRMS
ncbi:MAG: DegT/DnrJ/EryC1/StrS family aminotransferase [Anaerolineales bacterium]|nr:DegT/DnrJ/EryC1/StrS family aminotransferase [Anaerolineales bacterium]